MYTMEDIILFLGVVLIEHALKTGILAKFHLTLLIATIQRGWLNLFTLKALDIFDLIEGHPLRLAALLVLIFLVVAQFTWVEDLTARGFNMTLMCQR